jgi:hypothetical protein
VNSALERDGFEIHRGVLHAPDVEVLAKELSATRAGSPNRRSLLRDSVVVADLATSPPLRSIADEALGAAAFPVRALLFDKIEGANWSLPWHQDLAIPVAEKLDVPGCSGWSVKDGVPHVLPPAEVLAQMIALRVHLDDCSMDNAPLRVLPGSHRSGKLTDADITRLRAETPEFICLAARGDVLALRPLLLHASSAAQRPGHRRVLHIEYAAHPLPGGLQWFGHPHRVDAVYV